MAAGSVAGTSRTGRGSGMQVSQLGSSAWAVCRYSRRMWVSGMVPIGVSVDEWTAFGSIATAAALILGLLSLRYERRKGQHEEAALLRQRVQAFATAAQRVIDLLKDGSPLVGAAWYTACALRDQAGTDPTANDLRALIGDRPAALTAAVAGWDSSSAADELRAAFSDLTAAGRDLRGQLKT